MTTSPSKPNPKPVRQSKRERVFAEKAAALERLRANYEASPKNGDLFSRDKAGAKQKPINYYEYLQSPKWQRKRYLVLKRAKFRCQNCNCGGRLEVHHFTYVQLGREQIHQLIALCRACHQRQHELLKESGQMLAEPQFSPPKTVKSTQGFAGHERLRAPHDESAPSSPDNRSEFRGPVGIQGKRPFAEQSVSVTEPRRGMK